jgi:hypothetical protein
MAAHRVFLPQQALDAWLEEGRILLEDDVLTLQPEGNAYRLTSAARFMSEVASGEDTQALIGKVKTLEQIAALGGEHCEGSVVLGDNAYEIVDGFVGVPHDSQVADGDDLASATRAATGEFASADAYSPFSKFLSA